MKFTSNVHQDLSSLIYEVKTKLIGTEGTRLLRETRVYVRPRRRSRGGSRTARGKRVPGVEINVLIVQPKNIDILDFL